MFMSDQLLRKFRKAGFHAQTMEVAQVRLKRSTRALSSYITLFPYSL